MRSPARTEAAALAIRPIFTTPSTLELLGRYAQAEQALADATDGDDVRALSDAEFDAKADLVAHVRERLNINQETLKLLVGVLS